MAGIKIKIDAETAQAKRNVDDLNRAIKGLGYSGIKQAHQNNPKFLDTLARALGISDYSSALDAGSEIDPRIGKWAQRQQMRVTSQMVKAIQKAGNIAAPVPVNPRWIQSYINQSLGIGAGQNSPMAKAYSSFWKSAVPAQMAPPKMGAPFNWKQAGMGAMVAPFSPWLGARALSGAFGGGKGGGGPGAGIGAAIFGSGGLGPFMVAFAAIHVVVNAVKFAFMELHKAITDTAKLYQESARTATAPSKLFQLQSAFKAIGMTPTDAETLLVRGQHPLKGGGGARIPFPGTDELLGAGRGTRQIGELQQIKNMSEYIERAYKESAIDADAMASAVKPLQETQFQMVALAREWNTLWTQFSTLLSVYLVPEMEYLATVMKGLNAYAHFWISIWQKLGVIPKDAKPGDSIVPNMNTAGHHSAWEKMGFVIGGMGGNDHAKKTAENTGRTVERLDAIMKVLVPQGATAGYTNFYP